MNLLVILDDIFNTKQCFSLCKAPPTPSRALLQPNPPFIFANQPNIPTLLPLNHFNPIPSPPTDPTDTHISLPPNTHPAITSLLSKYSNLFTLPLDFPSPHLIDHKIPLIPNTNPINIRPYRYPHSQKAEIERQVQELLDSGVI